MDGIHDLGGKEGHGAVLTAEERAGRSARQTKKSVFGEAWEARVFAMAQMGFAMGIFHSVDHFRHTIERIDPVAYLDDGYYGRWLGGLETALVESGVLAAEQVSSRAARPLAQADVFAEPRQGGSAKRHGDAPPVFAEGARVRTVRTGKRGHTRMPAYVRGVTGRIQAQRGLWVFPDTHAHGQGEQPEHLYTVAFDASDLWAGGGERNATVYVDLFESYLEALT